MSKRQHWFPCLLLLVLLHLQFCILTCAEQYGWEMTDRFSGFRFELKDVDVSKGLDVKKAIQGLIISLFTLCLLIASKALIANLCFYSVICPVLEKADDLFCFGWVQDAKKNRIVGEARCSKRSGAVMKQYLMTHVGGNRSSISIKDYTNTQIKLHFSHFKIVHAERETCFRDPPHQCEEKFLPEL